MKSILRNSQKAIFTMTALFVYVSVARVIFALLKQANTITEWLTLTFVTAFILFVVYVSATLIIEELKTK